MLLKGTESNIKPAAVAVETYGNEKHVILADNIQKGKDEDGNEKFTYDEVRFQMDPERTETEKDIKKDFAAWWSYGSQEEEAAPTLEERIAAIEEFLMDV